jgi:hypothetical protein
LLAALLHDGLVTIRNGAQGDVSADQLQRLHYVADWLHNWPAWLYHATTDDDYAEIWTEAATHAHPLAREWARTMLAGYGISARDVGLTPEL